MGGSTTLPAWSLGENFGIRQEGPPFSALRNSASGFTISAPQQVCTAREEGSSPLALEISF